MEKGLRHGTFSSKVNKIVYILDGEKAECAYSLRKLRSAYTGPCLRVRRVSDGATKDIFFKSMRSFGSDEYCLYFNWEDALNFAGTSLLSVHTWYDQSGNGLNLSNTSSALFPPLTKVRLLNQSDQRFMPFFAHGKTGNIIPISPKTQVRLFNSSISVTQPFVAYGCGNLVDIDSGAAVFFDSYNNTQCIFYFTGNLESPNHTFYMGAGSAFGGTKKRGVLNFAAVYNGASSGFRMNGDTGGSGNAGTNSLSGLSLFHLRGNPNPIVTTYGWWGGIAEFIILKGREINIRLELNHKKFYKTGTTLEY